MASQQKPPQGGQQDLSSWPFTTPEKSIKNAAQLEIYLNSDVCLQYERFLTRVSGAVKGKRISQAKCSSPLLNAILGVFVDMKDWLEEIPPISQPMRYGNKAFRDFLARLDDRALSLMTRIFGDKVPEAGKEELGLYFRESFGNSLRIDYGTGHETNFVAFMFCLEILGLITPADYEGLVLLVFDQYINLMRHIQKTYMLEPAGSHGVWSLDDYQFLPFYFGAAQFNSPEHQSEFSPKQCLDEHIRAEYKKEFMYFAAIDFIFEMKTGPFAEHSPILYDMSQVKFWHKLHGGLLRMYKDEVLKKFPIMQHYWFGSIIPFPEAKEKK
uniref:Serine/threonine-protein phosphatase 2A activator n=1 Tax=Paramoeba aestuarina TaxID=180227 RepID=A0A7S4NVC1_9EUKA|mmetsp:Transcript_29068/g.44966  ORF Transcript_29068/g.44966 Transcript_29068/m.44966 type:complete len:326 (+) Transcript_29068:161-1138(+)